MKHDFRTVKAAVMNTVKEMDQKDPNWKWKAEVQKSRIKIFWGYLDYVGEKQPFIITDGEQEREECWEDDEFIVLRNEHDEYMSGRLVGTDLISNGSLEQCVISLMKGLQGRVNRTY